MDVTALHCRYSLLSRLSGSARGRQSRERSASERHRLGCLNLWYDSRLSLAVRSQNPMNIPQYSLVLYKGGPARVVAIGDKLEIELQDGRSLRVRPKDVTLLHPGPLAGVRDLINPPAGEVEAACELLEGGQTTLPELAELVYGSYTPATAWAAWRLVDAARRPTARSIGRG